MSYQEPDDDDEVEAEEEEAADEFADEPWQASYAWEIVTGQVDVPDAVHAAAVAWMVGAFSILE